MGVIGYGKKRRALDEGGNENDKTESLVFLLSHFLFLFFFLPLLVSIDILVSGMSQDPAVKRSQNY